MRVRSERRANVDLGVVRGTGSPDSGGPCARLGASDRKHARERSFELPTIDHAGDGWRTAAASRRIGMPTGRWPMAGHAGYARLARAGLHPAAAGDPFVPVARAVLGSLVPWAGPCRQSGFRRRRLPPFPPLSRIPSWWVPAWPFWPWRLSRRPRVMNCPADKPPMME